MAGGQDISHFDTATLLWRILKHTGYNFPTEKNGMVGLESIGASGKPYFPNLSVPEKASTIANSFGGGIQGQTDHSIAGVGTESNIQSVRIYQLNPAGLVVEKWTLHNPMVKSINWGDLDYESDDPVEYSLDIEYDWAELAKKDDGFKAQSGAPITTAYNSFMKDFRDGLQKFEQKGATTEVQEPSLDEQEETAQAELEETQARLAEINAEIEEQDKASPNGGPIRENYPGLSDADFEALQDEWFSAYD